MVMPSAHSVERPALPEYITWEELENLPDEVASQIELRDGRVWLRRGPGEHQTAVRRLTNDIEPLDLRELIDEIYAAHRATAQRAGIGFTAEHPRPRYLSQPATTLWAGGWPTWCPMPSRIHRRAGTS
ncbi:hypothetical protein [Nocardia flavorosea]|uniref:hypothetical protein n=1 Tax=Nocardia flavorosea TaxID=53429 RepID=UPI00353147EB